MLSYLSAKGEKPLITLKTNDIQHWIWIRQKEQADTPIALVTNSHRYTNLFPVNLKQCFPEGSYISSWLDRTATAHAKRSRTISPAAAVGPFLRPFRSRSSCSPSNSAAADGVVPALLAVRLEVLVVVLLAVVAARLVGARNDRVAVVCQCHQKCIAVSSRSSTQDNFFFLKGIRRTKISNLQHGKMRRPWPWPRWELPAAEHLWLSWHVPWWPSVRGMEKNLSILLLALGRSS